jgi:protein SCO1/2
MQHSLTIYLMGPDGRFRTALAHDLGPERAAEVIRRAVARG